MAYVPIPREKVLAAIEKIGASQPLEIKRETGGDSVLIGAVLSEMAANGMVAISRTKRGGSPFYYLPAKPESLERLNEFLGEKDQRTYRLLKDERVLREDALDPLSRVSLGNIPDFSRRFVVDGVAYWRYYLFPEDEAIRLVKGSVKETRVEETPAKAVATEQVKKEPFAPETVQKGEPKAKKPRKRAAKPVQQTMQQAVTTSSDPLYERVRAAIGPLRDVQIRKPEAELVGVHTGEGPHGRIETLVWATTKRVVEKALLKALLEARSKGMPLLVLAEDFPKKAEELVEETPNVHRKRL